MRRRFAGLLWAAILVVALGNAEAQAEPRPVESAEALIALILESWKEAEAETERDRAQPDWKQGASTAAVVSDREFPGAWLIQALADPRLEAVGRIRVVSGRITGGLDFQQIPETPLESLPLPANWSTSRRQNWIARARERGITGMHVVLPDLVLANTTFDWHRGQFLTFNARRTLFGGLLQLIDVSLGDELGYGQTNFHDAIFAGNVDLDGISWSGSLVMSGAVAARAFNLVESKGTTVFAGTRFEGEARFRRLKGGAFFVNTSFEGPAHFFEIDGVLILNRTHFRGPARLVGRFTGDVDLSAATFDDQVSFRQSDVHGRLLLKSLRTKGFVDFRDARLRELDFRNPSLTLVPGRVDFRGARIASLCLKDVVFAKDVDFSDALLGAVESAAGEDDTKAATEEGCGDPSLTSLRFVTFEGNAFFLRSQILGDLTLEDVGFNATADFTDAVLQEDETPERFLLSYVRFADLAVRWDQLPPPQRWSNPVSRTGAGSADGGRPLEPLSAVLFKLEESFRRKNLLHDANEAHYQAKLAELAKARQERGLGERWALEAEWLFWGLTSGYGRRIWPLLGGSLLLCLFFAVLFSFCRLERRALPESSGEFNLRLRLLDMPHVYLKRAEGAADPGGLSHSRFVTALRLSALLLFKIGYRDTLVSGRLGFLPARALVLIEWLLGFYVLACLTITLANTWPLVNRLISGVF